jgi:hypothetical protein
MTWLLLAVVAGGGFLVGSIGGVIACGLGRIAAHADAADRAAWERWRLTG